MRLHKHILSVTHIKNLMFPKQLKLEILVNKKYIYIYIYMLILMKQEMKGIMRHTRFYGISPFMSPTEPRSCNLDIALRNLPSLVRSSNDPELYPRTLPLMLDARRKTIPRDFLAHRLPLNLLAHLISPIVRLWS